ncbi:MAG: helix-turn-helix domain-containing protein [Verrucomicrobia bacterium]|nr:helix-turn-helix domain-containing protein [Verrucomicrobiota bacterium]
MKPDNLENYGLSVFSWDVDLKVGGDFRHYHPEIEIMILEYAEVKLRHGDSVYEIEPDHLVLFWGMREHQVLEVGVGAVSHGFRLPIAWVLPWNLPRPFFNALLRGQLMVCKMRTEPCSDISLIKSWKNLLEGNLLEKEAVLLQARARVLQVAAEFSLNQGGGKMHRSLPASAIARFEKLARTITENYMRPVRGDEIAASAGMHHSSAMRLFRQVSGMSIHEFMTSLRVEHAKHLLLTTDLTMEGIASQSGFGSPPRLYAAFAKFSKQTPGNYRSAMGKGGG